MVLDSVLRVIANFLQLFYEHCFDQFAVIKHVPEDIVIVLDEEHEEPDWRELIILEHMGLRYSHYNFAFEDDVIEVSLVAIVHHDFALIQLQEMKVAKEIIDCFFFELLPFLQEEFVI